MGYCKEHLEELTIRDLRWIISDLNRFGMARIPCADLLITRCSSRPSSISGFHVGDSFDMFEDGFHSPKTASCKNGSLFAFSACKGRIQSRVRNRSAGGG